MLRLFHPSAVRTVPVRAPSTGNGATAPRPITALIVDPSGDRQLALRRALSETTIFDRRLSASSVSEAAAIQREAGTLDAILLHWSLGGAALDTTGAALLTSTPLLLIVDAEGSEDAGRTLATTLGAAGTLAWPVTAQALSATLARIYTRR